MKLLLLSAVLATGCSKLEEKLGGCGHPPKMVNGVIDCLPAYSSVEVSVSTTGEQRIMAYTSADGKREEFTGY